MEDRTSVAAHRAVLASVAPGTPLRDGLERILRGRTGALIVLGFDQAVEDLCDGGFRLDVEFSSTRLRELCKMDGAVVLNDDATPHPAGQRAADARTRPSPPSSPAPGTAPPNAPACRPGIR